MITFSSIRAGFDTIELVVQGDGSSKVLKLNLSNPPFNLVTSVIPFSFTVDLRDEDLGIATASVVNVPGVGNVMTVNFDLAPPASATIGPLIQAIYQSLVGSITYRGVAEAGFNGIVFLATGNNTDTVLKFDTTKVPFSIPFGSTLPSAFGVAAGSLTGVVTSIDGSGIVTLTFPSPINGDVQVNLTPIYNSL